MIDRNLPQLALDGPGDRPHGPATALDQIASACDGLSRREGRHHHTAAG